MHVHCAAVQTGCSGFRIDQVVPCASVCIALYRLRCTIAVYSHRCLCAVIIPPAGEPGQRLHRGEHGKLHQLCAACLSCKRCAFTLVGVLRCVTHCHLNCWFAHSQMKACIFLCFSFGCSQVLPHPSPRPPSSVVNCAHLNQLHAFTISNAKRWDIGGQLCMYVWGFVWLERLNGWCIHL